MNDSTQNNALHTTHPQSTSPVSITSETDTSPDLEIIDDQPEMMDLRIETKKIQDSNFSPITPPPVGRDSNYLSDNYLNALPSGGAPAVESLFREMDRRSISPAQIRRLKDYSISSIMQ